MKEKNLLRISMLSRVQETLEKHRKVWKDLPQAARTYEIITHNNLEINGLRKQVEKDLSPLVNQALSYRKRLIRELVPVASILQVIAWELRDGKLAARVNYKRKKIKKMKDTTLVVAAHQVLEEALRIIDLSESAAGTGGKRTVSATVQQVQDYGLTREKVSGFASILKDFEEAYMESKDSIEFATKCGKRIRRLLKESNRLLDNKLDLLLSLYETTGTEFYRDYMNARQLVPQVTPRAGASKRKTSAGTPVRGKTTGRKRGRPRKTAAAEKKAMVSETAESAAPKKRGRKPGSTNRKKQAETTGATTAPRRRGRPPKKTAGLRAGTGQTEAKPTGAEPKRRRGRPPKKATGGVEKTAVTEKTAKKTARKTTSIIVPEKAITGTKPGPAARKRVRKTAGEKEKKPPVQPEPPKEEAK